MIEILVYPADEVNEKIKKLEDVIEQSRKEKEWLECKVLEASQKQYPELSYAEKVVMLEDDMQEALKDE